MVSPVFRGIVGWKENTGCFLLSLFVMILAHDSVIIAGRKSGDYDDAYMMIMMMTIVPPREL